MRYSTLVIIAASLSAISALPIIPGHSQGPNDPNAPRDILKREAEPEAYEGQYKGGKPDPHTIGKREAEAEANFPAGHPTDPHVPDVPRGILKREADPEAYWGQYKGGKTDPHTLEKREAEAYEGQHKGGKTDPHTIGKREAEPEAEAYWGQYKGGKTDPHTLEKREAEAYEGQHKGGKTDPHTIGKREAEPEAEAYWGQYKGGKTDPHTIEKREAEPEAATPEHHPSTRNTPDIPRDILKREAEPEAYEGQYKGGKTDPHTIGKREAKNDGKVPGRTVPIPKIN